jgi:hypothetical protein
VHLSRKIDCYSKHQLEGLERKQALKLMDLVISPVDEVSLRKAAVV